LICSETSASFETLCRSFESRWILRRQAWLTAIVGFSRRKTTRTSKLQEGTENELVCPLMT
jgi:hypothetical protein